MNLILPVLVTLIIVRVFVGRAERSVDDAFVDEWARAHALVLTPRNRPVVHWYLRNARLLRTWGALAGLFLPKLIDIAFGLEALEQAQPFWVFVGYLVGAVYAELALVRPADGGRRVAALSPRDVEDYLPRRLLLVPRVVAGVCVVLTAVLMVLPFDAELAPSRSAIVALTAFCVVLCLGLERLERWLVQRPQPFTEPELVAADDAIRSQALHSVAGSGLAMELLVLGGLFFALAVTDVQLLRWTMWLPALSCMVGSIYVCLYYGHRAWRVRRSVARPAST